MHQKVINISIFDPYNSVKIKNPEYPDIWIQEAIGQFPKDWKRKLINKTILRAIPVKYL